MQLGLTKKDLFRAVASVRLGQRLLWAARHGVLTQDGSPWVVIVIDGSGRRGVRTIVDATSVEAAWKRIQQGEMPPSMPSEAASRRKIPGANNGGCNG